MNKIIRTKKKKTKRITLEIITIPLHLNLNFTFTFICFSKRFFVCCAVCVLLVNLNIIYKCFNVLVNDFCICMIIFFSLLLLRRFELLCSNGRRSFSIKLSSILLCQSFYLLLFIHGGCTVLSIH